MLAFTVKTTANDDVFITHPVTGETWNITPILELVAQLGQHDPALAAEKIYDLGRYIAAEQHSQMDSAARLRQVLRLVQELGAAFDSIRVADGGVVRQLQASS